MEGISQRNGSHMLNRYVIVTPPCNMANGCYPNNILLALCKPMADEKSELQKKLGGGKAKQVESAKREIRNYATQGHHAASHFLPPIKDSGPLLVEFRDLVTVSKDKADELLKERVATITPSFVPNLMQRYAAYLGRIGASLGLGSSFKKI